jgi:hypothetical protein
MVDTISCLTTLSYHQYATLLEFEMLRPLDFLYLRQLSVLHNPLMILHGNLVKRYVVNQI